MENNCYTWYGKQLNYLRESLQLKFSVHRERQRQEVAKGRRKAKHTPSQCFSQIQDFLFVQSGGKSSFPLRFRTERPELERLFSEKSPLPDLYWGCSLAFTWMFNTWHIHSSFDLSHGQYTWLDFISHYCIIYISLYCIILNSLVLESYFHWACFLPTGLFKGISADIFSFLSPSGDSLLALSPILPTSLWFSQQKPSWQPSTAPHKKSLPSQSARRWRWDKKGKRK